MTANAAIEFLVWLLIAASVIAVVALRFRLPYTVALVMGGLALGSLHLPVLEALYQDYQPNWLTPDVILFFFLPPLLFEGSLKVNIRQFTRNLVPILLLANVGVLAATLITGYAIHWVVGLPILVALLFGAMISATDPISVLAIFKEMAIAKRLSLVVEAESLLNDGTAVVLFQILLAGIATGEIHIITGIGHFLQAVLGGAAVGLALGYLASILTKQIDDAQIEITLTTIVAYSSYLLAHHFHFSGVIATVAAGVIVGNVGAPTGMSVRTRLALWSFWEYASFVINSLVFLLIGLEVRVGNLLRNWPEILLAVAAVLLGRILSVYALTPVSNLFAERIPFRWQHVLVWGGLHGSLSLALALSLGRDFAYRDHILALTFGVVAFSIIGQGLTIKPLLRALKITSPEENEYAIARVEQIAISAARTELEELFKTHVLSRPVYEALRRELDDRLQRVQADVADLYSRDAARVNAEMRTARTQLLAAERSSIEEAIREGLITPQTAARMIDAAHRRLDERERSAPSPESRH